MLMLLKNYRPNGCFTKKWHGKLSRCIKIVFLHNLLSCTSPLEQPTSSTWSRVPLYPRLPSLYSLDPVYPRTRLTVGPKPLAVIARSLMKVSLARAVIARVKVLEMRNRWKTRCWWKYMTLCSFTRNLRLARLPKDFGGPEAQFRVGFQLNTGNSWETGSWVPCS